MALKEEILRLAELRLMQLNVSKEIEKLKKVYGNEKMKKEVMSSGFYVILKQYL